MNRRHEPKYNCLETHRVHRRRRLRTHSTALWFSPQLLLQACTWAGFLAPSLPLPRCPMEPCPHPGQPQAQQGAGALACGLQAGLQAGLGPGGTEGDTEGLGPGRQGPWAGHGGSLHSTSGWRAADCPWASSSSSAQLSCSRWGMNGLYTDIFVCVKFTYNSNSSVCQGMSREHSPV